MLAKICVLAGLKSRAGLRPAPRGAGFILRRASARHCCYANFCNLVLDAVPDPSRERERASCRIAPKPSLLLLEEITASAEGENVARAMRRSFELLA